MAVINEDKVAEVAEAHLEPGEKIVSWAYGVKQPHILLIVLLMAIGVLPGVIVVFLLTKNYLLVLTNKRLLVLTIKGPSNAAVKHATSYALSGLRGTRVKTSAGMIFVHICIDDAKAPFVAKFHRAYSKSNRPNALQIAETLEDCASEFDSTSLSAQIVGAPS